jgi:hypothetical protein
MKRLFLSTNCWFVASENFSATEQSENVKFVCFAPQVTSGHITNTLRSEW